MKKFLSCMLVFAFAFLAFAAPAMAGEDYTKYTPHAGRVRFFERNNAKYARIEVTWDSTGLSGYSGKNATYEQELVFYNYDGKAYATRCAAYQTDVPNPYLDTQFLDNKNEANLAIGTYKAKELKANRRYYYSYQLAGQLSDSSMYKVSGQKGKYILFQNPGAVFASATGIIIPFKNGYAAPESVIRCWSVEDEPNNSTATASSSQKGRWFSGVLSSSSDVDYIKIYLNGRRTIRLISPSKKDYDATIYNASGNWVGGLHSTENDETYTRSFASGYYYIKVYSYSGSGTDSVYYLIVE